MGKQEQRTQYALINKVTREHATVMHQDDEETPLVSASLTNLVGWIGDMYDMGADDAIETMLEEDEYEIVVEEVVTIPLARYKEAINEALKELGYEPAEGPVEG